jgi:hypothetical protein
MSEAGANYYRGIADFGQGIAQAMEEYHKRHVAYDSAHGMADALSKVGIDKTGQVVPLMDQQGKSVPDVQPLLNPKSVELFQAKTASQRDQATGALQALSRVGINVLQSAMQHRMSYPQGGTPQIAQDAATGITVTQIPGYAPHISQASKSGTPRDPQGFTPAQAEKFRRQDMTTADKMVQDIIKPSPIENEITKTYKMSPDVFADPKNVAFGEYDPNAKRFTPAGTVVAGPYQKDTVFGFGGTTVPEQKAGGPYAQVGGKYIPTSTYQAQAQSVQQAQQARQVLAQKAQDYATKLQWANTNQNDPRAPLVRQKAMQLLGELHATRAQTFGDILQGNNATPPQDQSGDGSDE